MGVPPSGRLARFYWETFHLYLVLQHAWRRSLGEISHLTLMMMKACNVRACVHAIRACSLRFGKEEEEKRCRRRKGTRKEEWPVHSHTGAQCALVHTTDWCTVCSVLWCTPQTGAGTGAQCALCSGAHHRLVHSALCALVHTTDWCRDWCTVCSLLWCTPQTSAQCTLCSGAHHRLVQGLVHSVLSALVHTTDWCRDWCTVCSLLWCTPQTGAGTGAQCALCSGAHHRLVHSALCALVHTTDWCRDWCTVLCKGMHVDWGHRWMSSWQQTKLFLRRFCEKRERGC